MLTYAPRSPQRRLPLFQAPGRVFGMSAADRLANALQIEQDARKGMLDAYAAHCAALGHANTLPVQYRKAAQRDAFLRINLFRKALRENARNVAALQAKLVALSVPAGVA